MSEFERARERAERRAARKGISIDTPESIEEAIAVIEQQEPKAPKKRSNEIAVSVWIDGNEYSFTFKTNITGTMLGSQQNKQGMQHLLLDALRAKFGTVEMV